MFKGKPLPVFNQLPLKGLNHAEIRKLLLKNKAMDVDTSDGRTWAYVYEHSKEHSELVAEAF